MWRDSFLVKMKVGGFEFSFGEITSEEDWGRDEGGEVGGKYNRKDAMALSKGCHTNETI